MQIKNLIAVFIGFCLIGSFTSSTLAQSDSINNKIHPVCKSIKSTTIPNGYTPSQIKKAYGINKINAGNVHQTIAIVEAYGSPTIQKDLDIFTTKFNLPKKAIKIVYPNGRPNEIDYNWATETALDVEWAHAINPDASIMLIVAKSESLDDLLNAVKYATQHNADIVSMSWNCPEFENESVYDSYFVQPNTIFISSSGDSGPLVVWPSASPNVISVGGTTLTLNSNGNLIGEEGWYGSGGGVSTYEFEPYYQKKYGIKSTGRCVPDISIVANPGVSIYNSTTADGFVPGWDVVGGTSIGAPICAAIIALANQNRSISISDGHRELYQLASKCYESYYRDITSGSNAHTGYDFVTGLGSPLANKLIEGLKN